jgi:integrase
MSSSGGRVRVVRRKLADGSIREYRYDTRDKIAGPIPDSLGALLAAYRRSPEYSHLASNTVQSYRCYLRHLEELADQPVTAIRRRTLLHLRDALAAESGNGAANVFIRTCSALFKWARDREWIEHSPAERVPALPGGHWAAWTAEEADRAIRLLPEPLARVVILARYTGQRRGDLCAMMWSAFDGTRIKVRQQKTKAELTIPCHHALRAALTEWRGKATSTHILVSTVGRPWVPMYLTHEMARVLPMIGLRDELNVHGLRKLAAAELAEAGCTEKQIASITGHRSLAMIKLYTESAEQKRLADAAIIHWENAAENARKTHRK